MSEGIWDDSVNAIGIQGVEFIHWDVELSGIV